MIVTESTLVGYTVVNGSWGLQLGLMIGAIFNLYFYPNILSCPENDCSYVISVERQTIICHAMLVFSGLIANNKKIRADGLKYAVSFLGVFFYIYT